jgi:hypothetical protein
LSLSGLGGQITLAIGQGQNRLHPCQANQHQRMGAALGQCLDSLQQCSIGMQKKGPASKVTSSTTNYQPLLANRYSIYG